MFGWVQDVPLQINTLQFLKFTQRYVKMEDEQRWNHSNHLCPVEF